MSVKSHFLEAQAVLEQFLADETNFEKIAQAGQLMVECLENGGKLGGSVFTLILP